MSAGVLAVAAAVALRYAPRADPAARRPTIAVAHIHVAASDSAERWLSDGLPQMLAAKLSRNAAVEVVPPAQVRAVQARAGLTGRAALSTAELLDVGRRLGATLVVGGELARRGGGVVLDLGVYDVKRRRLLRSEVITSASVLALADEATVRLLDAAGVGGSRPRLAELETPNLEAYHHYVRHVNALLEGRYSEARQELDAAIALDSGFISAVQARLFLAWDNGEYDVAGRLSDVFRRLGARASERDRLEWEAQRASTNGEHSRSEALARQLVERYPRDLRGYSRLAIIYWSHGRWTESERVTARALALDSLGMEAGRGPCVPCAGYSGLTQVRMMGGNWAGAEQAARRWVALQPDVPAAWSNIAQLHALQRRYDDALAEVRRALSLSGGDPEHLLLLGRVLVMARRHEAADSAIAGWLAGGSARLRAHALDLTAMLARERGQLRASNRVIDSLHTLEPGRGLVLLRGDNLIRLGDYAGAERLYEDLIHGADRKPVSLPLTGGAARAFCWHHALAANALAGAGDTVRLRALADTLEVACGRSYYARDWRLHHHVRGLIAMRAGRYEGAVREFRAARWGVAFAWTRSLAELARAHLALGQPHEALAVLRDAYAVPLDAMGRYLPRSELDYLMALAFRAAVMPDSAAVYAAHVRRAWKDADPEVQRLLAALP